MNGRNGYIPSFGVKKADSVRRNAALRLRFEELGEDDRGNIAREARSLQGKFSHEGRQGLGEAGALELLYQVGWWLNERPETAQQVQDTIDAR